MPNPFAGIISAEFKATFKYAIDSLLETTALTVPCIFYFGDTKFTNCPNCKQGMGGLSSNKYNGTGPVPFSNTICPVCVGKYKLPVNTNETIYMAVIWDHKKWLDLGINISTPDNYCVTMSKITTYASVVQAKNMMPNSDIQNVVKSKYEREGNPRPLGLGEDAYILTIWKKCD